MRQKAGRIVRTALPALAGGALLLAAAAPAGAADPALVPTYTCRVLDQNVTGVTIGEEGCTGSDGAPSGYLRQPLRIEVPALGIVFVCQQGVVRLPNDVQGLRCAEVAPAA